MQLIEKLSTVCSAHGSISKVYGAAGFYIPESAYLACLQIATVINKFTIF